MIGRAASTGVPPSTMAVLMLSVFTVSMGYGIVLPLLLIVSRQPDFGARAIEQVQRKFWTGRIRFQKKSPMERRQLILQSKCKSKIAAEACRLKSRT